MERSDELFTLLQLGSCSMAVSESQAAVQADLSCEIDYKLYVFLDQSPPARIQALTRAGL